MREREVGMVRREILRRFFRCESGGVIMKHPPRAHLYDDGPRYTMLSVVKQFGEPDPTVVSRAAI